jgi:uroporphyrinogen-III synthase
MAGLLENISVAILEHRFTKEFSTLFEKLGATVYACPLLEEKPVENRDELQLFVRSVLDGQIDMMIFLTGVGARFLVAESESMGERDAFLQALGHLTIVVRGPKPVAALRQLGLRAQVTPENPTTEGVIEALRSQDLRGRRVGVQLYGTPNPQLVSALEAKGASVRAVQVYAYGAAADSGAVSTLVGRILDGGVRVVAFTSAPQVRMLLDFAAQSNVADALREALNTKVAVAAVGEVTSRALHENGIVPRIVPAQSKMAALVQAVGEYFSEQPRSGERP